jgi:hypothetical protein
LEVTVHKYGLDSIEQLLEQWQAQADEIDKRWRTVQQIDTLRGQLFATYGEMPDSTALIRADRER